MSVNRADLDEDVDNIPAPSLPLEVSFQRPCNERKMEANSSQTQCPVFQIFQRYIGKLKLPVLLVLTTEQTFKMVHLHFDFTFHAKPFCCTIVLVSQ